MSKEEPTITASDILAILQERRIPARDRRNAVEWIGFPEMRVSTGYDRGEQRIDYWEMNMYPGESYKRLGYEIKVSRSDFASELKRPQKRRPALMLCNRFYFIAPAGIVPLDKLPIDSGLIEVKRQPAGHLSIRTVCEAPWLDTEPPPWGFVASLVRRAMKEQAFVS